MSLIVFEGIDRSGKSTLSVNFVQYLNNTKGSDGCLTIDPHFGPFVWTKEPNFSSAEADLLNSPGYVDEFKRERLFFESRLRHQNFLAGKNIICDRYIWTGLAYAYKYSPATFRFAKELYSSEILFLQPDLYIFLDTPPEVCASRDASLDLDNLRELREAYFITKDYLRTPVIVMQAVDGEDNALKECVKLFEAFIQSKNSK